MKVLKWLKTRQLNGGQFPTVVRHDPSGLEAQAATLCPTYLITMMLMHLRQRRSSNKDLDRIVEQGLAFLGQQVYRDPVGDWLMWHFNAFYPPDWEETCWCSLLLYEAGHMSRSELRPLWALILANETPKRGVGVWVKDPYTPCNAEHNAFDPVVSLAVTEWLNRVFSDVSEPTAQFFQKCREDNTPSLYYNHSFQQFLYWLLGQGDTPPALTHDRWHLFHNARRRQLIYASKEVWRTAELLIEELS